MPLCPGLSVCAGTRKVKPIWILLKQETVSGSGIHWAICRSAPRSTQITMPAPHRSVFYSPDALPAAQPTVSKHWRQILFSGTLPQTLDLQKKYGHGKSIVLSTKLVDVRACWCHQWQMVMLMTVFYMFISHNARTPSLFICCGFAV